MQLRYPVRRLLPVLLLALPLAGRAQTGVTIGALTAPDIVSSSKGALLPRVAAATAIATPATGLIVFQTNAPAGFYYNAGTPTAASWQRLLNSGSTEFIQNQTGADQTGGFRIGGNGLVGGRIGIGTSTPAQKLTVSGGIQAAGNGSFSGSAGADQGAHLQWNCSGSEGETWLINHLGGGGASAGIRFGGVTTGTGTTVTEWGRFLNNGNFGLGTTAPTQKLDVVGNASISGNALIGGNVGR